MADFRAKRGKILETLKAELKRGFIEKEVTVSGHKFKLKTLSEDDEVWADSFMRTLSTASILSSRKAPRLAASIQSIDDTAAAALFEYPDDMSADSKKGMEDNPIQKRYWTYTQMLYFLSEESNRLFINELWAAYEALETEQLEATKQIPNS